MTRITCTTRFIRRYFAKIVICGALFAVLIVYYQTTFNDSQDTAVYHRQRDDFQRPLHSQHNLGGPEDFVTRRNLRAREQLRDIDGVNQSRENINIPKNNEPTLSKPAEQVFSDSNQLKKPDKLVLNKGVSGTQAALDKQMVFQNQDGDTKERNVPDVQGFENLPDKSEHLDVDVQEQSNVFNDQSDQDLQQKDKMAKPEADMSRYNSLQRRKLNNDVRLPNVKRPELKAKSLSKHSAPEIRIMPKHPSVPEGRSLMVTCADVLVLSRVKSNDEAMYMTFDLPNSMPRRLKNAVHIIVRPGIVTLRFANIKKDHAGVYKCLAEDKFGNKYSYDFEVHVLDRVVDGSDPDGEAMALEQRKRQWEGKMMDDPRLKHHLTHEQFLRLQNSREKKWAKMGMMDAYEYDYDSVGGIIEELRDRFGSPPHVNLTALAERGKFQQRQMDEFCENRGYGDQAYSIHSEGGHSFNRHILINDKAETLFCFVPKVGCTNLKVLFFVVQGFIPFSQLLESRDNVNQQRIEDVQLQESFLNRNEFNKEFALRHYFKFMMVRNPLHRLVSGYRSKVQRYPLVGLNDSVPHYNFLRKAIYLHTHPEDYSHYLRKRGRLQVNITFSDFIDYWLLQSDDIRYDEHFRSMFKICEPCRARFDFYANFKNFEEDTQLLVDKINTRPEFVRTGYYSDNDSTETLSPSYYSQLTLTQKMSVLKLVELDLDFYYHVYPEDRGSHNSILGLDHPVSLPLSA